MKIRLLLKTGGAPNGVEVWNFQGYMVMIIKVPKLQELALLNLRIERNVPLRSSDLV